ncbi:histamine H2 receptor-like isoform X3 [Tigriopus californicus]|uniref:histamine H2 receptor-like isoform X3 n=1 Tax=Tigriopus californicus TaxID=6832 RepID=UPI0027DA90FE|nr:histamine H2 receptor-like isoform X3 [Tigriopus californicus]
MAVVVGPGRKGPMIPLDSDNSTGLNRPTFECNQDDHTSAIILITLGVLGVGANVALMAVILFSKHLRRWSQGLLFHQALVDCARAAILMPLGTSILNCKPVNKCSLVETAFLLLVTVSTVNLLTTVLNDAPVLPDDDDGEDALPMLMDSPQCVVFGMFMIWFASITINLGPTFLSGALAANSESYLNKPSCPLIQGPYRHYVLNVLWIFINVLCVLLTMYHLYKLYKDLSQSNMETLRVASLVTTMISVNGNDEETRDSRRLKSYIAKMEQEGIARVKMFLAITIAYLIFWGPLFLVTLFSYGDYKTETPSTSHEVTLHVAFVHAFVNPTLFLVLHKGLRRATLDLLCCNFRGGDIVLDEYPSLFPSGGASVEGGMTTFEPDGNGGLAPDGLPPIASINRTYMLADNRHGEKSGSKKETTL